MLSTFFIFGTGWNDVAKKSPTRTSVKARRSGTASRKLSHSEQGPSPRPATSELAAYCTESARRLVLASWNAIIQGMIEKAMAGGHQQAKFLVDLCSLPDPEATELNEERKRQLCDALLEGLDLSRDNVGEIPKEGPEHRDRDGNGI